MATGGGDAQTAEPRCSKRKAAQQQHMMRLLAKWADEDPERLSAILALLGK